MLVAFSFAGFCWLAEVLVASGKDGFFFAGTFVRLMRKADQVSSMSSKACRKEPVVQGFSSTETKSPYCAGSFLAAGGAALTTAAWDLLAAFARRLSACCAGGEFCICSSTSFWSFGDFRGIFYWSEGGCAPPNPAPLAAAGVRGNIGGLACKVRQKVD